MARANRRSACDLINENNLWAALFFAKNNLYITISTTLAVSTAVAVAVGIAPIETAEYKQAQPDRH